MEGLVHSGVTTEYPDERLARSRRCLGESWSRCSIASRRGACPLQPDYFGFLVDDAFLCGYGLGSPEQTGRNLPYLAATTERSAGTCRLVGRPRLSFDCLLAARADS